MRGFVAPQAPAQSGLDRRAGFAPAAATGYLQVPGLSGSRPKASSLKTLELKSLGATAMSMQGVVSPAISFTPPKRNSLTHIP